MAGGRHTPVSASTPLTECPDRQFAFRLPLPLDQRLDDLVDRAISDGLERTNRRELLAALLLAADFTGEELSDLIRGYRGATAGGAVLSRLEGEGDVIQFARHKPGPRRR